MKFKKAIACVGVAALTVSAVVLGGCGIFGKGRRKTITENGFSVELTTKYDQQRIPSDDDILYDNMIMRYESDDILFSVSQVPRDEIIYYHVFDLSTFVTFIVEDCYGSNETVYDFKSEDGSIDGCTLSMYYTNSYGYRNVQTDYLFAGTQYFYEVSFVTVADDYSKLADDIKSIVLSCKADDGLNNREDIGLQKVEYEGIEFYLDDTFKYDKSAKSYNNAVVSCEPYFVDTKHLTLEGVLNRFLSLFSHDTYTTHSAKTAKGTDFLYCTGTYKKDSVDYKFVSAMYIDSDGYGYILDFTTLDYFYADRFLDDAISYAKTVTGSIDNYQPLTAASKKFEDKAEGEDIFGYSLTLDDTFYDLGWDDDYEEYMLWSAEYDRFVSIAKTGTTSLSTAKSDWQRQKPQSTNRSFGSSKYGGLNIGWTYLVYGSAYYYLEVAFFIETESEVVIVTISLNSGYFETVPGKETTPLDPADILIINAIKDIQISFE